MADPSEEDDDLEAYWASVRPAPSAEPVVVTATKESQRSPVFCEHANEVPGRCRCDADCYCKLNTCRPRSV